jgi:glycosyltransferase involved in cell wall biosynthesis
VRFGAVIHDPVRDVKRGGQALHRYSLRQAYSFLDVAFVHDSIKLDTAGAPSPKLAVIPIGPFPVPEGKPAGASLRDDLGIPKSARVLLSFGHIRDGKCLDAVLEAMVTCPDCHLIVAGREQSAGQKPASTYQAQAQRLGITNRCHWFINFIPNDEVWKYFRASDLLLLLYSQNFHSMSGVLNVNAQFRLPVLASAGSGPLLKAIRAYELGPIISEPTPTSIAQALHQSHQLDARWDDYLKDHSWEQNAERVVSALCA